MALPSNKTFRVQVTALGCAGITVERPLCSDMNKAVDAPPRPKDMKVVVMINRGRETLGTTPLSNALRRSPTNALASTSGSRQRFLALWPNPDADSAITLNVEMQDPSGKEKSSIQLASSRWNTKNFNVYIGVQGDGQVAVPIAAANLSLNTSMRSQTCDLTLYPVSGVCFDTLDSSRDYQEEKKDDVTPATVTNSRVQAAYGIDCLDALLRVQIVMEEISILPSEVVEAGELVEHKTEGIEVVSCTAKEVPVTQVTLTTDPKGPRCDSNTKIESPSRWKRSSSGRLSDHIKSKTDFREKIGLGKQKKGNRTNLESKSSVAGASSRSNGGPAPPPSTKYTSELPHTQTRRKEAIQHKKASTRNKEATPKLDPLPSKGTNTATNGGADVAVPKTKLKKTSIFVAEVSNNIPKNEWNDEISLGTNDGTAATYDTYQTLRTHLKAAERLVEMIPLPECKSLDRLIDPYFDEDDESTFAQRDSVSAASKSSLFKLLFSGNQCDVVGNLRSWRKPACDPGSDHDEAASIVSMEEPGAIKMEDVLLETTEAIRGQDPPETGAHKNKLFNESRVQQRMMETEESTLEGTLNSFPFPADEISSIQDTDHAPDESSIPRRLHGLYTSFKSSESPSRAATIGEKKFLNADMFACLSDKNVSESSEHPAKSLFKCNRLECSNPGEVTHNILTKVVPRTFQRTDAASDDLSPNNVADFPGLLEDEKKFVGNFRQIFTTESIGEARHPLFVPKGYQGDDGSSIGDLTLTTHEMRVEIERFKEKMDENLAEAQRKMKPSPGSRIFSLFYCGDRTTPNTYDNDRSTEYPFDEKDPFASENGRFVCNITPEMRAAASIAWAKRQAETNTGRRPSRVIV